MAATQAPATRDAYRGHESLPSHSTYYSTFCQWGLPAGDDGVFVIVNLRWQIRCAQRRGMPASTVTPLDTFARQRIQARINAIRANIRERDGRDLTGAEVAKLRRLLEREAHGEAA